MAAGNKDVIDRIIDRGRESHGTVPGHSSGAFEFLQPESCPFPRGIREGKCVFGLPAQQGCGNPLPITLRLATIDMEAGVVRSRSCNSPANLRPTVLPLNRKGS